MQIDKSPPLSLVNSTGSTGSTGSAGSSPLLSRETASFDPSFSGLKNEIDRLTTLKSSKSVSLPRVYFTRELSHLICSIKMLKPTTGRSRELLEQILVKNWSSITYAKTSFWYPVFLYEIFYACLLLPIDERSLFLNFLKTEIPDQESPRVQELITFVSNLDALDKLDTPKKLKEQCDGHTLPGIPSDFWEASNVNCRNLFITRLYLLKIEQYAAEDPSLAENFLQALIPLVETSLSTRKGRIETYEVMKKVLPDQITSLQVFLKSCKSLFTSPEYWDMETSQSKEYFAADETFFIQWFFQAIAEYDLKDFKDVLPNAEQFIHNYLAPFQQKYSLSNITESFLKGNWEEGYRKITKIRPFNQILMLTLLLKKASKEFIDSHATHLFHSIEKLEEGPSQKEAKLMLYQLLLERLEK